MKKALCLKIVLIHGFRKESFHSQTRVLGDKLPSTPALQRLLKREYAQESFQWQSRSELSELMQALNSLLEAGLGPWAERDCPQGHYLVSKRKFLLVSSASAPVPQHNFQKACNKIDQRILSVTKREGIIGDSMRLGVKWARAVCCHLDSWDKRSLSSNFLQDLNFSWA
jgi:hypothetical protein